jgi:hypothetical protein
MLELLKTADAAGDRQVFESTFCFETKPMAAKQGQGYFFQDAGSIKLNVDH